MNDGKLISIKTGKPIEKPSRKKNSQDAKRWRYLLEKLESGELVLSASGVNIVTDGSLDDTIMYFDEKINDAERIAKNRKEHNRRQYTAKENAGLITKNTD